MRFSTFIMLLVNSVNIFECANGSERLGRIARGHVAAIGQFPYVVRLKVRFKGIEYLCGGALISSTWLLTAAHCFDNSESVIVHLGSICRDSFAAAYDIRGYNIKIHPSFVPHDLYNDIALVKIPRTNFNENISYVPLPRMGASHDNYEGAYAIICGWGEIPGYVSMAKRLHWGRLMILRDAACYHLGIANEELCTSVNSDMAMPCLGDSGGPLVLETTGELIGIGSSVDNKNCLKGGPAFYTRVTAYLEWIKSVSGVYYS